MQPETDLHANNKYTYYIKFRKFAMKIHEYQAKQLFAKVGIPIPAGIVVKTPEEAAKAFETLGSAVSVVKSQIHAGGRG